MALHGLAASATHRSATEPGKFVYSTVHRAFWSTRKLEHATFSTSKRLCSAHYVYAVNHVQKDNGSRWLPGWHGWMAGVSFTWYSRGFHIKNKTMMCTKELIIIHPRDDTQVMRTRMYRHSNHPNLKTLEMFLMTTIIVFE
jgi:hypothetical protein